MTTLKILIVRIISLPFIGRLIAFFTKNLIMRNGIYYQLNFSSISPRIKALIFWNLYEKAEINFVKDYLSEDYPVIELGGSIGILSAVIGKKIRNKRLFIVEANPDLIPVIKTQLEINQINNFEIIHAGIGNDNDDELFFLEGEDNTVGKVINKPLPSASAINIQSLSSLLKSKNIKKFILVSDIEGAENNFIFQEPQALVNCKELVIELHESHFNNIRITIKQQISQLKMLGFTIVRQHGPVVFAKK